MQFFNDVDCQVLKEIDENNKVIKYSFKRKYSEDSGENSVASDQTIKRSHTMLVSYQFLGIKNDRVSISLFEFDEETSTINPRNFIIIQQRINTHSKNNALSSFSS